MSSEFFTSVANYPLLSVNITQAHRYLKTIALFLCQENQTPGNHTSSPHTRCHILRKAKDTLGMLKTNIV